MNNTDLIKLHSRALDQLEILVGGVEPSQMSLPTPCEGWTVRNLLAHVVEVNRGYADIARRSQRQGSPGPDVLGDDPVEAYRQSAEDLKQAWSDSRLLEEILPSHHGELPGRTLLWGHVLVAVGHGWDLAKATGQQPHFDPDVVQVAMQFAQVVLKPLPRGTVFGPPVEVGEDVSQIDRFAAFLGRSP